MVVRERAVKRSEDLRFGLSGGMAERLADRIDLEIARPGAIHHHVMLVLVRRDRQTVAAPSDEVDGGRAEQRELLRIDDALEVGNGTIEQHDDVEGVARPPISRPSASPVIDTNR